MDAAIIVSRRAVANCFRKNGRIMLGELLFPTPCDSIVQGLRQHRMWFAENQVTRLWARGRAAHRHTSAGILSIEGDKRPAKGLPGAAQTLRAQARHTCKRPLP